MSHLKAIADSTDTRRLFVMADPRTHGPGAEWPLRLADLDDVEMLEMTRDDDGRLVWKSETAPTSPEAFRDWMPKRRRDTPPAPDASPPAASAGDARLREDIRDGPGPDPLPLEPTPPPIDPWLPTRLDMSGAPSVSLAELLPDLWPVPDQGPGSPPDASPAAEPPAVWLPLTVAADHPTLPSHTTSSAGLAAAGPTTLPPMRLALAEAASAPAAVALDAIDPHQARPSSAVTRGRLHIIERLALVAAGMLIGMVLTLVWGRVGDGHSTGSRTATAAAAVEERDGSAAFEGQDGAARSSQAGSGPPVAAAVAPRAPLTSSVQVSGQLDASPDREPAGQVARNDVERAGPQALAAPAAAVPAERPSATAPPAIATVVAPPVRRKPVVTTNERPARLPDVVTAAPPRPTDRRRRAAAPAVRVRQAPPAVLDVVRRYAVAYSRMDARATQAVWPAADRQMLASTFNTLREQRLTLSGCRGQLVDVGATVSCRGTLRYRPRVGDHSTRTRQGTWRFALAPDGDTWRIDLVTEP